MLRQQLLPRLSSARYPVARRSLTTITAAKQTAKSPLGWRLSRGASSVGPQAPSLLPCRTTWSARWLSTSQQTGGDGNAMHEASRVKIPIDESSSSNTTPYDHASSTQSGTSSPAGSSSGDGSASAASAASASSASVASEADPRSREIIELKDSLLRSVADYRNLQERTKREVQSIREFAIQRFATDLLESLDNLDRALSAVPVEKAEAADAGSASPSASPSLQQPAVDPDLVNLYSGLKMTYRVLTQTLNRHGLQAFDPSADGPATTSAAFDPNRHEAIFMAPQPGKENGTVFHTQQKGYTLNGRVVRAAKVGVVKNSE